MKPAFHPFGIRALSMLAVCACILAGCGQKGPLYLPAKPVPVSTVPQVPAEAAKPVSQ